MALIFRSEFDRADLWRAALARAMPDLEFRDWAEPGDPADVEFALVWRPAPGALRRFANLKVIFSLGAGVDHLVGDSDLPGGVPVVRMIEPGLTRGMTEYVALHTLRHHRRQRELDAQQRAGEWKVVVVPTAPSRRVGVMGLGVLGAAAAAALVALEFDVAGWSRTPKTLAGIESFHGEAGLARFLARTEILVCLLPLTPGTRDILNAGLFAGLPQGACLINAARGGHLIEDDLLAALESGQIAEATLDVFRAEPPPSDHAFWSHARVTMTPHNASITDPDSGARRVADVIGRSRRGETLPNTIDPAAGY
ncbi:MAG: glyoxylate/hydroxypyruvate reductase A [Alphaproteobacteria bacterium]